MKFGGTSVADLERISRVARIVAAQAKAGRGIAVVVSAMSGETNKLVAWTDNAGKAAQGIDPSDDEYDVIVASGEQVTAGLLAMTLRAQGLRARSWLGWQIPILCDTAHGAARIDDIPAEALGARIDDGEIAVIAGFQGVTAEPPHHHPGPGRLGHQRRGHRRRRSRASAATSTRTWTGSTPPTPGSRSKRQAAWPRSPTKKCSKWPRWGPRFCRPARSRWPWPIACPVRVLSSFVEPGEMDPAGQGTIVCDEEEIMEKRIVSGVAYSARRSQDHPAWACPITRACRSADLRPSWPTPM